MTAPKKSLPERLENLHKDFRRTEFRFYKVPVQIDDIDLLRDTGAEAAVAIEKLINALKETNSKMMSCAAAFPMDGTTWQLCKGQHNQNNQLISAYGIIE